MKFIPLIILLVISRFALAQQYGWVPIAQIGNQFNDLYSVQFIDSLHGWIGDGTIGFRYSPDGGITWLDGSGATVVPYAFSMYNSSTGWAAGWSGSFGGIHKTADGGATWIEQQYQSNRQYLGTATHNLRNNTTSGQTRNVFPDTGKLAQTTNGGTTWTERTIADSIRQLGKVQFVDSLHGWVISSGPGGLVRTIDGGIHWQFLTTPRGFSTISFIDTLRGWAAPGALTEIYCTTDGGVSWQFRYSFIGSNDDPSAKSISFVDSLNGWMFSTIFYQGDLASGIYRTTDGGWSWYREHAGQPRTMSQGLMVDRYHGWAVGSGGIVLGYQITNSVPEPLLETPRTFSLRQNYPNPFNPATTIEYEVPQRSRIDIRVADVQGKIVRELVREWHEAGVYRIRFDATGLASGTYFCTMQSGTSVTTKQMTLLK